MIGNRPDLLGEEGHERAEQAQAEVAARVQCVSGNGNGSRRAIVEHGLPSDDVARTMKEIG